MTISARPAAPWQTVPCAWRCATCSGAQDPPRVCLLIGQSEAARVVKSAAPLGMVMNVDNFQDFVQFSFYRAPRRYVVPLPRHDPARPSHGNGA